MSPTYFISPNDWLSISFRLCLALLFGAIIGWERELRHKPAGLRTNSLVSLGAAMFVLIPIELDSVQQNSEAFSRVIQGIATGVGFVGGGAILRESQSQAIYGVRGLTSAAAVWVSAALGTTAGCGLWQIGIIGTLLSFVVLKFFKKVEN